MKAGRRYFAALCAGAVLLTAVGCGSSDDDEGEQLPQEAVASLERRLDEVRRRFDSGSAGNPGACADIEDDSYKAIDSTVENLPADVDQDVRKALEESLSRLQELTREGCANVEEEPEEETTPTETVEPPPPTETVPPQTETTETVPQDQKPKDKEKEQNGTGNGNGNGNGNGGGGTQAPSPGGQIAPQVGGE